MILFVKAGCDGGNVLREYSPDTNLRNFVELFLVPYKIKRYWSINMRLMITLLRGMKAFQKWHLQKSASDNEVKIELRPVLAQFKANLSFPTPGMLLSGL